MTNPSFKLIHGGKSAIKRIGRVKVYLFPHRELERLDADTIIFEEDTNLILTIDRTIHYHEEHPIRLMTNLMRSRKQQIGSLVTQKRHWYAVVVDIDADPICRPQWVWAAYERIRERLNQERVQQAVICLLGGIYGNLPIPLAVMLFADFLRSASCTHLREISLLAPDEAFDTTRTTLVSTLG